MGEVVARDYQASVRRADGRAECGVVHEQLQGARGLVLMSRV